ncbi:HK97 gp10 family phage protein [Bradyrhizobium japonicum]|uniref:HK97 gp10 family phage protein n=1 Tax=Bradyrhizobium TaxID=374 RepID=UPI0004076349|nr:MULTISPECIES: HK97 gp10 family phage protein [Bradyrhizobium]MBR0881847.1 HK97 gp10 family phage protein [Bradyrhizobium liaoningense]MBR0940260.1 HK97 gp10 family phage protein [Bradyrhizobium liaoningense]MBR1001699.1 HK97 gp10 family phage protein [Bradyrhizobium liaoningense]MBR1065094.1 HK97 gp10 family phage protein [Bradyrhizobium liaoningense]MCP1741365.1 HK97 gp10 family phage protein [Bradyrhizobium japonicum]
MSEPDDELQSWFSGLSYKLKRELAGKLKEQADELASAIKAEAPVVSGTLRDSVKVRRRRNELELEVVAGGETTSKEIRAGAGVDYDYALAIEYGTTERPAEPFFYNTARKLMPDIQENIEQAVADVLAKA